MKKLIALLFILLLFGSLEAKEGSVVCIHGFLRSYKCMIPMGNTFKREGVETYLWDYPSRKASIESHADNLVKVLNGIAKKKPGEPIHFTTHSFGGIIIRAAVNHPHCPKEAKIGKAVLLAPPSKGTELAKKVNKNRAIRWFFGKKAGRQLLDYDEAAINSLGDFPDSMNVMVIAGTKSTPIVGSWISGPNDGKVRVDETCVPTPHEHRVLHVGHSWIMTSRQSIALTREFILRK